MDRQRKKTPDQIKKDNIKRFYSKLKEEVADKEEVWLDLFQCFIPLLVSEEVVSSINEDALVGRVKLARRLTDVALEQYEERWGSKNGN